MAGEVSFEIVGVDKASDAFQKVGKSVDDTAAKLDKLSKIDAAPPPKALTDGMKAVETATARLSQARRIEADELGKVRVAEAKLAELREIGVAKQSQLIQAEERLAAAHRRAAAAQEDAASAAITLHKAREEAAKPIVVDMPKPPDIDMSAGFKKLREGFVGEMKSAGLMGGAALAGGIASGLSTVGAAGLFVAIAAAAQSGNQKVADAYKNLWEQVKTGAQQTSVDLADDFIAGAERLGGTFNALKPQLMEGFQAAQPVIGNFFDGIARGTQSAMPGLVAGAKAASEASNGVADAMDSAGRSVSNFFTESAKGAPKAGDAFRSFGVIVERLGTFAGRILADLANNSGTVFPVLESTVDSAATAVENLARTALPALASGASFTLSGLGLLLNLVSTLTTALGPVIPLAMNVATSLKLIDMVSFGGVGRSWSAFKTSIGDAEGLTGKLKAGFGGVLTTLGPIGLAAGLVTVGLGALAQEQQEAAAAAAAHARRVDTLTDALRASSGVVNDSVRAAAAKALQDMKINVLNKDMLTGARELNINQSLLTDAYMGNATALGAINHELDTIMSPFKDYNDMVKNGNPEEQKRWVLAELIKKTLNDQGGEFQEAAKKARDYATAAGESTGANKLLAAAFKTLADDTADAQQKAEALVRVMDSLAGRNPDIEEATRAWEELIDSFKKDAFEAPNKGTKKWASSLIDARGQINLTSEDGRKLFDIVRGAEKDFATTAQAMKDSGASAQDTNTKLQGLRDQFIDTAQKMGFTRDQASRLADAYGMVPNNVSTMVNSNLAPELQKAIALGGTVQALPDGWFVVHANTDAARNQITSFIQDQNGRVITIRVNTLTGAQTNTTVSASGSVSRARLKAGGGWVDGPGTTTSDSVNMWLSNKEFVVNADDAAKNANLLQAINSGRPLSQMLATMPPVRASSSSGGGSAPTTREIHYHLQVVNAGGEPVDVEKQFARMELLSGAM